MAMRRGSSQVRSKLKFSVLLAIAAALVASPVFAEPDPAPAASASIKTPPPVEAPAKAASNPKEPAVKKPAGKAAVKKPAGKTEGPLSSQIPLTDQVLNTFNGYRNAVLANDGKKAATFVTKPIFEYFTRIRDWTLYAPADKVKLLPITDQVTILRLRATIPTEKLAKIKQPGKTLFILSVEQEWLEKEYLKKVELKKDFPIGEDSQGVLIPQTLNGHVLPGLIRFTKENKQWKLDAYGLLLGSSFVFEKSVRQSKADKVQLVEDAIASIVGKKYDQAWWAPAGKLPPGKKLEDLELDTILPQQLPLNRRQQS